MADEIDLENLDTEIEKENKTEKRIKDLSEKVRLASEDRDEKKKQLEESLAKAKNLETERDFLNSFGDQLGKYPEASSYKDKIKEKVLRGYSVEDATMATLVAEGKYIPPKTPQAPPPSVQNFGGGSATTQPQMGGQKPINELTREEKRAQLMDLEARGDISIT